MGYLPLTPRRLVANRADWVRPARGLDLRLQYQPPHWRVNLSIEHYWGTIAVAQEGTLLRHPMAMTLGVGYTPLPLVTAEYGFKVGSGRGRSHQLQLVLRYRLGVPVHQLDPQQVATVQSLDRNRLALAQRNVRMVLQQQPNDEIQLALQPELISQRVGSSVTIALQLSSARPLEEWRLEWRGDLLQHTAYPSLNHIRDQARLILPMLPGTYRLQLVARNARGVLAYSNEL
jgi:Inverse autotransporter, beta-domain